MNTPHDDTLYLPWIPFFLRAIHPLLLEKAVGHWYSRSLQVQIHIWSAQATLGDIGCEDVLQLGKAYLTCKLLVCVVISNHRKTLCLAI